MRRFILSIGAAGLLVIASIGTAFAAGGNGASACSNAGQGGTPATVEVLPFVGGGDRPAGGVGTNPTIIATGHCVPF